MTDDDWGGFVKCLGMRLAGDLIGEVDDEGEAIVGDTLLMLMNADHNAIPFVLPPTNPHHQWERLFDTSDDVAGTTIFDPGAKYDLRDRSTAVFRTYLKADSPSPVTPVQAETMRKEIKRS
jgi:glycogen operon protein